MTIESAILADISAELGGRFDSRRLIPYVQMHEFEALLFSDPKLLADGLELPDCATTQSIRDQFQSPEEINDSEQTAPSKRIMDLNPRLFQGDGRSPHQSENRSGNDASAMPSLQWLDRKAGGISRALIAVLSVRHWCLAGGWRETRICVCRIDRLRRRSRSAREGTGAGSRVCQSIDVYLRNQRRPAATA